MSTETIVRLKDDIDGSDASTTIAFAIEGKTYEVDLNNKHAEQLRKALQPYVDVARRTTGMTPGKRRASALVGRQQPSSALGYNASAIREWAQANGVAVNEKGRVPDSIVEQYDAAQRKPAPAKKAAAAKV